MVLTVKELGVCYTFALVHKIINLAKEGQLPWWLSGKESTCLCRRCRFDPLVGKIPWRRKWQPTPEILPGESHGQRSLTGYSPWGHEESDRTEQLNNNKEGRKLTSASSGTGVFSPHSTHVHRA